MQITIAAAAVPITIPDTLPPTLIQQQGYSKSVYFSKFYIKLGLKGPIGM